jgi:ATP-dependent helicase/nuclease subunit B
MKLIFGLDLDKGRFPQGGSEPELGVLYTGPQGLLKHLETLLGLAGHPTDIEFLRIEAFRQGLLRYLETATGPPFFLRSFEADPLGVATELLDRRDELLLSGWDFRIQPDTPPRLRVLAELELAFREVPGRLPVGYADRVEAVLHALAAQTHPFQEIWLCEPRPLMPPSARRLIEALEQQAAVEVRELDTSGPAGDTDLAHFQRALLGLSSGATALKGDGSMLLLRSRRASDAARYAAQLFRLNPDFRPLCLIPERNRSLDEAMHREGLPSPGILSASLARPLLQLLKLVSAFLWNPVDPFKVLEFVTLPVKPLNEELGNRIAEVMAKAPGIGGEGWNAVYAVLGTLPQAEQEEYRLWFQRRRYPMDGKAPKDDIIRLYRNLQHWARKRYDDAGSQHSSLLVLSEQARRLCEMAEALPEEALSPLELERLVRTVYEASPIQFREPELGHLPYVHQPGSIWQDCGELLWWNFVQNEPVHFFDRWYAPERSYLASVGASPDTPVRANELLLWQRMRPVLRCRKRLVLVLPDTVLAESMSPHPLYGDLQATFESLAPIAYSLHSLADIARLEAFFRAPELERKAPRPFGHPKPFLEIPRLAQRTQRESESYSSLDSLFYYPHQWVLRHQVRLRPSPILSVVKDETLMGLLAHRVFEKLFKENRQDWTRESLYSWVEETAQTLFEREGAVLLLFGREPERISFVRRVCEAAWVLLDLLRSNSWDMEGTEVDLEGSFDDQPIRGIADLVLRRGDEYCVLDLKWRGIGYRRALIRNEEDLQLAMYAHLVGKPGEWAHTAFFIINRGQLLARNNRAFRQAEPIAPDSDLADTMSRIWERMRATFRWRKAQLGRGLVEIRCAHTLPDLELAYQDEPLFDLLEMKQESARYDDYKGLLGTA